MADDFSTSGGVKPFSFGTLQLGRAVWNRLPSAQTLWQNLPTTQTVKGWFGGKKQPMDTKINAATNRPPATPPLLQTQLPLKKPNQPPNTANMFLSGRAKLGGVRRLNFDFNAAALFDFLQREIKTAGHEANDRNNNKSNSALAALLAAKSESDRKNYSGKHAILRRLLDERAEEFYIDSDTGAFYGITHAPSGFRLHLPKKLIPVERLRGSADAAVAKEAAESHGVPPAIVSRRVNRKKSIITKTPDSQFVAVTVNDPDSPTAEEPVPDVAADEAIRALRRRQSRRTVKKVAEWQSVPRIVSAMIKAGRCPAWEDGDPLVSPERLIRRLVITSLALPDLPVIETKQADILREIEAQKQAAEKFQTGDLFTPSIPVDAFNNAVWNDVWQNPFGTKSTFGDNDQTLRTPPQVAALVSGVVSGAGAARDASHVSPWDVGVSAASAAGKGWLAGLLFGKTVGTLAGLSQETQKKIQDIGIWSGLLTGVTKAVFKQPE